MGNSGGVSWNYPRVDLMCFCLLGIPVGDEFDSQQGSEQILTLKVRRNCWTTP